MKKLSVLLLMAIGCTPTATIKTRQGAEYESKIHRSDSEYLYLDNQIKVHRNDLRDIDHPGDWDLILGAVCAGIGIAVLSAGISDCEKNQDMCISGGIATGVGIAVGTWGYIIWDKSKSAAAKPDEK